MKASVPISEPVLNAPAIIRDKSLAIVFCDLVKARLTALVLLTTLVGFYVGSTGPMDYGLMFQTLLGTGLVACGASALNQLWEREYDAKMRRTQDRPLPSGRMRPETVLAFGLGSSALGLIALALWVNWLSSLIGAITLGVYVFIYTPLKRATWLNTIVGAVPGALPPVIGWAAAQNALGHAGWSLFAIMFFWQVAHFMAIAWLYREEYEKAGFIMLPTVDPDGSRTGRVAVVYTVALLVASLGPVCAGVAGLVYLGGALILGAGFLWVAIEFARKLTLPRARQLFYASILYLPLLLTVMVLDKVSS